MALVSRSFKLIYFLLIILTLETPNATGLSIKLIHRDSIQYPFYTQNRTERLKLLLQTTSNIRTKIFLNQRSQNKTSTSIRPILDNQDLMYMVQVSIGTFTRSKPSRYTYFLHLDTANDLTWTQCDECRKGRRLCFRQLAPLFPAARSSTYGPLPCGNHPLCFPGQCIGPVCSYHIEYGDGAQTSGYLARESFTFSAAKKTVTTVKDTVFGCGIRNTGFAESSKKNLVAGNFGLGPGPFSFLRQHMGLTMGRFSYCFPPWDAERKSDVFLRFGADVQIRKDLKTTRLLNNSENVPYYFVELKGISVGPKRLDIPAEMLARKGLKGGCCIDSGTTFTVLPPAVYAKMREALVADHLSKYKPAGKLGDLRFCYFVPTGKTGRKGRLPNITFHLRDSEIVLTPELAFVSDDVASGRRVFCLAMLPANIYNVILIGSYQQANTRYVFDTVKSKLYFGPEDCTRSN
ncbi:eukaryotic aspartyl protease family protein [Striga asiatica]|uniref:Eukaryotic aspartyl protease family protein n=1 Tax=Striga asiatica TaxID=4170 RepID=A0A5A7P132_STRAF|nr:eukaryotic aspartyl protease family protein [Striga asiatica]